MKASTRANTYNAKRDAKQKVQMGALHPLCKIAKGKGKLGRATQKPHAIVRPLKSAFTAWSPRMEEALGI